MIGWYFFENFIVYVTNYFYSWAILFVENQTFTEPNFWTRKIVLKGIFYEFFKTSH